MALTKELFSDLKEKYDKTEVLISEKSKLDPPTEPFKSHYEAREILLDISKTIKQHTEPPPGNEDESKDWQTLQFILVHITVGLGKIYNFTEELSTGEKYLNEALELVKDRETDPALICATLSALNECSVLWMNRGETEKARDFLIKSETYYNTFKEKKLDPLSIDDLFGGNSKSNNGRGERLLDKINVLTLFYLAQVFGSLGDVEKSAIYCHTTLKRQLNEGEFEPIDWALNAATLSQYFCTNNRYTEVWYTILSCDFKIMLHFNL